MTARREDEKNTFPRMVYRKGTGKKLDESGKYEAQGVVVQDEEQLKSMGTDWVESPEKAAVGREAHKVQSETAVELKAEHVTIKPKA